MGSEGPEKRYCIIGAGTSGLAAAKNFKERRIPFDCFESESDVGGIWNPQSPHAVYESTYLNSSKRLTRYTDFPMSDADPHYLSRDQAQAYIRAYAHHFDLHDHITLDSSVEKVEQAGGRWQVTISGKKAPRSYHGLVIANGHHWDPKWPDYQGKFDGETIHSHDLKTRERLKGRRVLVIGAGNSAADIACDAARDSERIFHSMRRSYYFFPKMVFGQPTDVIVDLTSRWPLPRAVMRWLYRHGLNLLMGPHEKYGLAKPDHGIFEAHPTAAATYLDHIAHGRIAPKPEVDKLMGSRVRFKDGSEEKIDLIVCATGFRPSFPFIDPSYVLDAAGRSRLFIHTFHRELDNLFAVGLIEPAEGGMWQLVDYQSKLVASFIVACERDPDAAAWFRKLKASAEPDIGHGISFKDSDWHKFEIQHYRYRTYMKRLLSKLGPSSQAVSPAGSDEERSTSRSAEQELRLAS